MMAKAVKVTAGICFLLTILFATLHLAGFSWATTFAITFGTCFYHFAMRLAVGHTVDRIMGNRADYSRGWYQLRPFEVKLYRVLQVKKWKGNMPTYAPEVFDPKVHSWEEIAQAMCQAEIVHEVIVVFSFLPLLAAIPFGTFPVFFITSLLAALYDSTFVIMQRYNRPRILKYLQLTQKRAERNK